MKSLGFVLIFVLLLCLSCQSPPPLPQEETPNPMPEASEIPDIRSRITLTFAGDIMAHNVNYRMSDYSLIYEDVENILKGDDLSFANFEAPVADSLPYNTYPRFNVRSAYADAAIRAGFDVFSLANNHINDQGMPGIKETSGYFSQQPKNVYYSGPRTAPDSPLSACLITKNGWNILYLAVTEVLYTTDECVPYINYYPPYKKTGTALTDEIKRLRDSTPCDLFIVSVHTAEPEYVRSISDTRKERFKALLDSGADIVWAHHPHVMQDWDIIDSADSEKKADNEYMGNKLVMYSMGNFISGQRYTVNLNDPEDAYEYTGDSILLQVVLEKQLVPVSSPPYIASVKPIYVTNYTDKTKNTVVKRFTAEFMDGLPQKERTYFTKRLELLKLYKGQIVCR